MAFSNFQSISEVLEAYSIKYEEAVFIAPTSHGASQAFIDALRFTLDNVDVYSSEGARTELIIAPILLEIYKKFVETHAFWVQTLHSTVCRITFSEPNRLWAKRFWVCRLSSSSKRRKTISSRGGGNALPSWLPRRKSTAR